MLCLDFPLKTGPAYPIYRHRSYSDNILYRFWFSFHFVISLSYDLSYLLLKIMNLGLNTRE